ncbi:MAG: transporter substrate-binding protein [Marmoricola sp.]|jgi:peptide/nickel transport system substrate-binding protein|nr:transporter substrate-binding protein [Marmoricola sp.]
MSTRGKYRLASLAAAALVLSACSSGGGTKASSDVLQVGSSAVATLDYSKSNYGYANSLGNLVLEPLVVTKQAGGFGPWLAKSWTQPNPTTYVYKLRTDVKFSDGQPLTAADVVQSLDYYKADGSLVAFNFPSTLKSIQALDSSTVEFKFSEPYPAWNSTLSGAALGIFEKKFFEAHKSTFGQPGTGVIGTGPWQVDSLDATTGAALSANKYYWGGKVPYSKINFSFFSNETNEAVALRTGEIDVAFPQDPRAFASTAKTKLTTAKTGIDKVEFWMNTLVAPWNDIHVRRAVAYALDRNALVNASGVVGSPLDTVIPRPLLLQLGTTEQVNTALDGLREYPPDLTKAKAEMAQSAYPHGTTVTLATVKAVSTTSQAVVAELSAIGITAKLETQTDEANNAELTSGNREAIHSQVVPVGGSGIDPGLAYDYMFGSANAKAGGWNGTNWSTPEVDKLRAEGLRESDPAKRLAIYAQLIKQYADAEPLVPLYTKNQTVALRPGYTWPDFGADSLFNEGPWPLWLKRGQ